MTAERIGVILAIVGPTASGKSALGLAAARELGGEIVNCDSMQMVRYMDIGTAKPSPDERKEIRHHLFDLVDPDGYYSAGRYMHQARRVCREIRDRGPLPIVVGGTGLYLKALLEGVFQGPGKSESLRSRLRRVAERRGRRFLWDWLAKRDPIAASRIEPGDELRVLRALEVSLLTREPISTLQQRRERFAGFEAFKVGIQLARDDLYGRINRRVERMFESGFLEEVKEVLARGFSPDCKGFEALGYRHAAACIGGKMSLRQAIEYTQRDTRRYAKRQLTWFRKDKDIFWIETPGEAGASLQKLLDWFQARTN